MTLPKEDEDRMQGVPASYMTDEEAFELIACEAWAVQDVHTC